MCECKYTKNVQFHLKCNWRYTARTVCAISIVVNCIASFRLGYLMLMALDAYRPDVSDPSKQRAYEICRKTGGALFVITFVLWLLALCLDIPLFLATDKHRATRDRTKCLVCVFIWMIISGLGLMSGFLMGGMIMQNGGDDLVAFIYPGPVIHLILIVLVIPYAVELSCPAEVQSLALMHNPSKHDPNPNDTNDNVGEYPELGGFPQSQMNSQSPSDQVAQTP